MFGVIRPCAQRGPAFSASNLCYLPVKEVKWSLLLGLADENIMKL